MSGGSYTPRSGNLKCRPNVTRVDAPPGICVSSVEIAQHPETRRHENAFHSSARLRRSRRPASGAKSSPSPGRRIELGDLTLINDIRVALEGHEDRDRSPAMLPATFAMAPRHRFRLTGGHEAYGAAQTAVFELIAHAAELSAAKLALHGNMNLPKPAFLRLAA